MMKTACWLLAIAACAALAPGAGAQTGELFVVRVGDGAAALGSGSTATFVNRYFDNGSVSNPSIALPIAASGANQPLTNAGTATSEGFIKLSTNGQFLTLAGYGVAPGTASVASTMTATVPRVVGRIELSTGSVDTTTVFSGDSSFTTSNVRGAVSTNGVDLWVGGDASSSNGGVRYTTLGSTTSTLITNVSGAALTNARVVNIFYGQLYVSSNSAPAGNNFRGVLSVGTGTPTTDMQPVTLLLPPVDARSSYDFWFKDASTLYVADDSAAANGGGIQKWTQSAGTWSLAYTLLNSGTTTTGVRGLTGTTDDSNNAVLFATTTSTSANKIIKVIDTGSGSTAADVVTAAVNTVFRGVQFVAGATPANNADFNSDNVVDGTDFMIWQRGFGLTGQSGKTNGNANTDMVVDDLDFIEWTAKFGGAPAVAAAGTIPEPGALALAVVGLLGTLGATRRRIAAGRA